MTLSLEDLLEVAKSLCIPADAGLVSWRARGSALLDSPRALPLHNAFRLNAIGAALCERRVGEAFAVLRSAGVEPVLGKGWAATRLYPSPEIRPCGDIDLYVREEDYPLAGSALRAAVADVDLHRGFVELDDRPPEHLLARSRLVPLGSASVRVFGPEDHLRLIALHMLRHGAWRPLWLCDVAAAVESRPEGFDWDYLLSGDHGRTEGVTCTIVLARDLLGATLDGVPAAIRDRRLPRWLSTTVLRQWSTLDFTPQGARTPMLAVLRRPSGILSELRKRWPNAVEATAGTGAPFNDLPRLPMQIAECVRRCCSFARQVLERKSHSDELLRPSTSVTPPPPSIH